MSDNNYAPGQLHYIASVDGRAHQSAVELIGKLEAERNALRERLRLAEQRRGCSSE